MTLSRLVVPSLVVTLGLVGGAHLAHALGGIKSYTGGNGITFAGTPGALREPSADTTQACRSVCNARAGCKGYSFDSNGKVCTIAYGMGGIAKAGASSKAFVANRVTPQLIAKLEDFGKTAYKGYDAPGHDLRSYTNVVTEHLCRALCAGNSECVAYTWRDSDDRCWLKDEVPPLKKRGGLVTGYQRWDEPSSAIHVKFSRVSLPGASSSVQTIPADENLEKECARRCRGDASCEAATVVAQGRKCSMRASFDPAKVATMSMGSYPTLLVPLNFNQSRRYRALQEGELACHDQPGHDLASVKTESMRLCRATCATTDGCEALTWNQKSQMCFMKSAPGLPKKNAKSCVSTTAWTAGLPM